MVMSPMGMVALALVPRSKAGDLLKAEATKKSAVTNLKSVMRPAKAGRPLLQLALMTAEARMTAGPAKTEIPLNQINAPLLVAMAISQGMKPAMTPNPTSGA